MGEPNYGGEKDCNLQDDVGRSTSEAGTHKPAVENVGDGEGKLSYKQVVAESSLSFSATTVFKCVIRRQNVELELR